MISMPCLENKLLKFLMVSILAAHFIFMHTSTLTYKLRDKRSLRLLLKSCFIIMQILLCVLCSDIKLNFCTHGGMQWYAAVALDLSKCEECGLWLSGAHSTTRM